MNDDTRQIELPSGKTAGIRNGKGRDLMRAHRAAAGNPEPMAVMFALIAELVEIDGKTLMYEDVLELDVTDVLMLQDEVVGGGTASPNFQAAPTAAGTPAAGTESSRQAQS
ncbi:MAG: hypothetical protein ACREQN_03785 [Candidatus Binataceae bacterium]